MAAFDERSPTRKRSASPILDTSRPIKVANTEDAWDDRQNEAEILSDDEGNFHGAFEQFTQADDLILAGQPVDQTNEPMEKPEVSLGNAMYQSNEMVDTTGDGDYEEISFEVDGLNEDKDDLFLNTFGKAASDEEDNQSDVELVFEDKSDEPAERKSAALDDYSFASNEHSAGCHGDPIRTSSIPPPAKARTKAEPPRAPAKIQPSSLVANKKLSNPYIVHKKLHDRALHLIPRLPNRDGMYEWPQRRYWIAVLILDKSPKNSLSEKDFVWMKANRLTTVRTVWHSFQLTTMTPPEDLVLLFGQETLEMTNQAQELDMFNDRLVVFRAVSKHHPEAKGKSVVDGLVPEIIEIEDD